MLLVVHTSSNGGKRTNYSVCLSTFVNARLLCYAGELDSCPQEHIPSLRQHSQDSEKRKEINIYSTSSLQLTMRLIRGSVILF